jgi:hypothetical protein
MTTATQWGRAEVTLNGPATGNPYLDVRFAVEFRLGDRRIEVPGFYDGEGVYKARLMPDTVGDWTWVSRSNVPALDGATGRITVGPARPGDHGPVRVWRTHHFQYADGTRYLNIGTTAYVWNLQGEALEAETLQTLAKAPFTKIRMCVFPKHYRYNQNEPELYPFRLISRGESTWPRENPFKGWAFDCDTPDPAYFRHLERRIDDLAKIGVEADLILLHPYDRWGFSRMRPDQDDRYLAYIVARLQAFPNVWWSMANEYDFMFNKSLDDWNRMIEVVASTDKHGHLLSVHNGFAPFDHHHPRLTHASIQRPYTERSAEWREEFGKPVSIDECRYEGDIGESWGNISGRELVHLFWLGTVSGGYITHGETFYNDAEELWWSKGGRLVGESVARIAFLRKIIESGPDGLDPMPFTGFYRIQMAGGLDHVTLPELINPAKGEEDWPRAGIHYPTAGQAHRFYLSYMADWQPREVQVATPPGERYSATLIDTWEMTETPIAASVTRGDMLYIPVKPRQALLLRRVDDS